MENLAKRENCVTCNAVPRLRSMPLPKRSVAVGQSLNHRETSGSSDPFSDVLNAYYSRQIVDEKGIISYFLHPCRTSEIPVSLLIILVRCRLEKRAAFLNVLELSHQQKQKVCHLSGRPYKNDSRRRLKPARTNHLNLNHHSPTKNLLTHQLSRIQS